MHLSNTVYIFLSKFNLQFRKYFLSTSKAELQKNTGHTCVSVAGGIAKFAYCIEYGLHQSSNLRFFCGTFFFSSYRLSLSLRLSEAGPSTVLVNAVHNWRVVITRKVAIHQDLFEGKNVWHWPPEHHPKSRRRSDMNFPRSILYLGERRRALKGLKATSAAQASINVWLSSFGSISCFCG